MSERVTDLLRVELQRDGVTLAGHPTGATPGIGSRRAAERELVELRAELAELHERLIANADQALLLVLQGLDASGKSGTIKHVVSALNPVGVRVANFVEPTAKEQREPFLERIRRELPERGHVTVFDRSHYEDAIVPAAAEGCASPTVDERVREILRFERQLRKRDVVVLKVFLHISYDEQRERFLRRLQRPDKQWKFSPSDIETRAQWPAYQAACGAVIGRTSTEEAPWHVLPADNRWYRNWAVASMLVDTLAALDQQYPDPGLDTDAIIASLRPPC